MDVSMDGIRRQLISNYNSLLSNINDSIDEDGELRIDIREISKELDKLRELIAILGYCKIDGEFDFLDDFYLVEIKEEYL